MTSLSDLPSRLTKIDYLTLMDCKHLQTCDHCYFFGEYAAGRGFEYSPTNQWIYNFKKPVNHRGQNYKTDAIQTAAEMFRHAIEAEALDRTTFVPIPPSKSKEDQLYDDRLLRMLGLIRPNPRLDIRELLVQSRSREAAHMSSIRQSPEKLEALWKLDRTLTSKSLGDCLAIVDDVVPCNSEFISRDRKQKPSYRQYTAVCRTWC